MAHHMISQPSLHKILFTRANLLKLKILENSKRGYNLLLLIMRSRAITIIRELKIITTLKKRSLVTRGIQGSFKMINSMREI